MGQGCVPEVTFCPVSRCTVTCDTELQAAAASRCSVGDSCILFIVPLPFPFYLAGNNQFSQALLSPRAQRHVGDISVTFFFVRRILVTDISEAGWRRAMKFCRMVDLGVHQVISPFGELWPTGQPPKPKSEKLRQRIVTVCAIGLKFCRMVNLGVGHLPFW